MSADGLRGPETPRPARAAASLRSAAFEDIVVERR